MLTPNVVRWYRLLLGALTFLAIWAQIINGQLNGHFNAVNFFSFFTIESNVLAAVIFWIGGFGFRQKWLQSERFAMFRGAAAVYMATTGIVYVLLLAGITKELQTTLPWVNFVLHYLMPLAVVVDWFVVPPQRKITFSQSVWWLAFPLAYVTYTLLRGPGANWYPYPFLNPGADQNYAAVGGYSIGIAVLIMVLSYIVRLRVGANSVPKRR